MQSTANLFKSQAKAALGDKVLQGALDNAKGGFIERRRIAMEALPEFEQLRQAGKEIKEHTLSHLDFYLEHYEAQVIASGGKVHWAHSPREACEIVGSICTQAKAKLVTKGKSMVGEEIALNDALEALGLEVVETDLGEYIIQLAKEPPSHIIAPAVHKTRQQITELFHQHHQKYGMTRRVSETKEIVDEARTVLRDAFLKADVGITGANFLIAESGSNIIVTNEGNGDLTSTLPDVHIVVASIEKVVPNLEDATTLLRLLARSATGQEMSCYTTMFTGPKKRGDRDGPSQYHVVLVDNGRSSILGGEFREILRCIRCGACLNHCPVYGAIGGHAYGWVYPGPMGSVLSPLLLGLSGSSDLPSACTLNGRCGEVCPMDIPLPKLMRRHRTHGFRDGLTKRNERWGLGIWVHMAKRPSLYQFLMKWLVAFLRILAWPRRRFKRLIFASAWTCHRDLPAPQGATFQSQWRRMKSGRR